MNVYCIDNKKKFIKLFFKQNKTKQNREIHRDLPGTFCQQTVRRLQWGLWEVSFKDLLIS